MDESTVMYGMSNFIGLYLFIIALMGIEIAIRHKRKAGSLKETPASAVGLAERIIRIVLLMGALPLLHIATIFPLLMLLSFHLPIGTGIIFALKWGLFLMWSGLLLVKAYMERKHVSAQSAVLSLIFGIPVIGLLYSIYTFTF